MGSVAPLPFLYPSGYETKEAIRTELRRVAAFQSPEQAKLLELAFESIDLATLEKLSRSRYLDATMTALEALRQPVTETIRLAAVPDDRTNEIALMVGVKFSSITITDSGEVHADASGRALDINTVKRWLGILT